MYQLSKNILDQPNVCFSIDVAANEAEGRFEAPSRN